MKRVVGGWWWVGGKGRGAELGAPAIPLCQTLGGPGGRGGGGGERGGGESAEGVTCSQTRGCNSALWIYGLIRYPLAHPNLYTQDFVLYYSLAAPNTANVQPKLYKRTHTHTHTHTDGSVTVCYSSHLGAILEMYLIITKVTRKK